MGPPCSKLLTRDAHGILGPLRVVFSVLVALQIVGGLIIYHDFRRGARRPDVRLAPISSMPMGYWR